MILIVTTVAGQAEARRIAHALVERQLAACVQLSAIESVYRWDGAVRQEAEVRLAIKTRAALYDTVQQALLELHPYDTPAIYALPVAQAQPRYARWVAENTAAPA